MSFVYERPRTAEDLGKLLASHGQRACVLAGGWPLRRLPSDQATVLDQALSQIDAYRVDLDRRRHDAEELARLLARGATDGAVTLTTTPAPTKGT